MVSVTQRIKEINQPRGGYLPIKLFSVDSSKTTEFCIL